MSLENPWHDETQRNLANEEIHDEELKARFDTVLKMGKNRREACIDKLFTEAKELNPKEHAGQIRDAAIMLINLDNSDVKGNRHNLQAGTLLNKLKHLEK